MTDNLKGLVERLNAALHRLAQLEMGGVHPKHSTDEVWALQAELSAALSAERGQEAVALIARLLDELRWCSGSPDFNEGGQARVGWLKGPVPAIAAADAFLKAHPAAAPAWPCPYCAMKMGGCHYGADRPVTVDAAEREPVAKPAPHDEEREEAVYGVAPFVPPFGYEKSGDGYRVADSGTDSRIATCHDQRNAALVANALNLYAARSLRQQPVVGEEMVMRAARELCQRIGDDPDEIRYHNGEPSGPTWALYEDDARAALTAAIQQESKP